MPRWRAEGRCELSEMHDGLKNTVGLPMRPAHTTYDAAQGCYQPSAETLMVSSLAVIQTRSAHEKTNVLLNAQCGLREDKRDPKAYQRHGIGARPAGGAVQEVGR